MSYIFYQNCILNKFVTHFTCLVVQNNYVGLLTVGIGYLYLGITIGSIGTYYWL
jgi:hypothetical protein